MKLISLHREPPRQPRAPKPGIIPAHQIPIYDHRLNMRGRVGPKALSATVARFGGGHGATLQTVKGRKAWVGSAPGKPSVSTTSHAASLRAARGSVGSKKK